ncbi:MAG: glutathione S-transferase family protein [Arenicella sp.]
MDKNKFHIIGHQLCPYVQRVVILMLEKQIPYERTDIKLTNKPEWLKAISPTGKVPVLVVNENQCLFESSTICEYLDEVSPGSLHPNDSLEKAIHRAWIVFGTEILDCIAHLIYRDKTYKSVEVRLKEISVRLSIVEQNLSGKMYFSGSEFSIVDAVYATIFRYFHVIESLTGIDLFSSSSKNKKWKSTLFQRKSVQNAVPRNYVELILAFIKSKDAYISREKERRFSLDK